MFGSFLHKRDEKDFQPITADHLRVGMHIWLDCAWYKHPFPKNRFKLTSSKQIETIRELKLTHIYYDPKLSDPEPQVRIEPLGHGSDSHHTPGETGTAGNFATAVPSHSVQLQLKEASRAYLETVRTSSEVIRQVAAGEEAGVANAANLIGHFTAQVFDEAASLGLANIMHLKVLDRVQAVHALNTCILSLLVGRELELEPEELKLLGLCAFLHDIGEQQVPSRIRFKSDPLTKAEKHLLRLHPTYAKDLLKGMPIPLAVSDVIAQHHEQLDGSGYPHGLMDEKILPFAKIIRVVDEYSYLVNPLVPSQALQPSQALAELYGKRQHQLSVKVIIALVRVLTVYPPGTLVELSDSSIGMVVSINTGDRLRPMVIVCERSASDVHHQLIDLNDDHNLSIVRTIHPAELSSDLVEEINPGQVLKYLLLSDPQNKAIR